MPITACSFLPAATSIIQQLGCTEQLVGVTFECPIDRPRVVRSRLEGATRTSEEINAVVAGYKARGESLYYIDMDLLATLQPDVIFTQDVCPVCQIDTPMVEAAARQLPKSPEIVPLLPHRLEEVWQDIRKVALHLKAEQAGEQVLLMIENRLSAVRHAVRNVRRKKIAFLEWPDPLYNCGHWIPDQITIAGGQDDLANPGGYSRTITWSQLQDANPEVLVFGACGLPLSQAAEEVGRLARHDGWSHLQAVQQQQVYAVDGDWFTCPGPELANGVALLAHLLHPAQLGQPDDADGHFLPVVTV